MVIDKKEATVTREEKIRSMRPASANKYSNVQSRLTSETAAMQNKKREKFKPGRGGGQEAMTMGGNLLGTTHRAQVAWRKGI